MIDVYAFATPNSIKVPMALEELGIPYSLHAVNVRKGEQSKPEFLTMTPNGKIPVIVDQQGPGGLPVTITESGAILVYLAEKYGAFIPKDPRDKIRCLEWLFFQVAGRTRCSANPVTFCAQHPKSRNSPSTATPARPSATCAC